MSNASASNDCVLDFMESKGLPMTRENYLYIAYFGQPPEELDPEEEAQIPAQFRDSPFSEGAAESHEPAL